MQMLALRKRVLLGERAPVVLDDGERGIVGRAHALLNRLVLDELREEATDERVARAVRVDNVLGLDADHGVLGDGGGAVGVRVGDDGRESAVRADDDAVALGVGLGEERHAAGDLGKVILAEVPLHGGGKGLELGLVADDVVPVGHQLEEGVLVKLGNEGGREVEGKDLVGRGGVLGGELGALGGRGQEEAADKDNLGLLEEVPLLGLLEVARVVLDRGAEVRHHRAAKGKGVSDRIRQ